MNTAPSGGGARRASWDRSTQRFANPDGSACEACEALPPGAAPSRSRGGRSRVSHGASVVGSVSRCEKRVTRLVQGHRGVPARRSTRPAPASRRREPDRAPPGRCGGRSLQAVWGPASFQRPLDTAPTSLIFPAGAGASSVRDALSAASRRLSGGRVVT